VLQLGLLRVETAMTTVASAYSQNGTPTIDRSDSLREALSLILKTGAAKLTVLDNGTPIGELTLDHIRNSARAEVS
jgi:osmoprotectant transport system ATP-binding protein